MNKFKTTFTNPTLVAIVMFLIVAGFVLRFLGR